jgi:hypothetical protein
MRRLLLFIVAGALAACHDPTSPITPQGRGCWLTASYTWRNAIVHVEGHYTDCPAPDGASSWDLPLDTGLVVHYLVTWS